MGRAQLGGRNPPLLPLGRRGMSAWRIIVVGRLNTKRVYEISADFQREAENFAWDYARADKSFNPWRIGFTQEISR